MLTRCVAGRTLANSLAAFCMYTNLDQHRIREVQTGWCYAIGLPHPRRIRQPQRHCEASTPFLRGSNWGRGFASTVAGKRGRGRYWILLNVTGHLSWRCSQARKRQKRTKLIRLIRLKGNVEHGAPWEGPSDLKEPPGSALGFIGSWGRRRPDGFPRPARSRPAACPATGEAYTRSRV